MGYYSDLRLSITKRDYLIMLEKDEKNSNSCAYILSPDNATVKGYKANGVECIFIKQDSFKYYKEFEDIQLLEKYLSETKNGYVFFRVGDGWDDIEYRNTARFKELEIPFKFIENIEKKARKDLLSELNTKNKKYKITSKDHIFTDKIDILEYFKNNKEFKELLKKEYDNNMQFKLVIHIDIANSDAEVTLFSRSPKEEYYEEKQRTNINLNSAISSLGYSNKDLYLKSINQEEEEEEFE